MKKTEIKKTIEEIIEFIVGETTINRYKVSMTHFFDAQQKRWVERKSAFDDIGDYVVFVGWAGKVFKQDKWIKFMEDQISIWEEKFKYKNGWYVDEVSVDESVLKNKITFSISPYGHQDAILGFYIAWVLTKKEKYWRLCKELLDKYMQVSRKNGGHIPNSAFKFIEKSHPWASANPAVAGVVAEHAALMGKRKKQEKLSVDAKKLISPWMENQLWKNKKMLPQGINIYFKSISPYSSVKIMKETSNMVFAMLEQSKEYKKEIEAFAEELVQSQHECGGFYAKINTNTLLQQQEFFDKTQNFTCIDLLVAIASNKDVAGELKKECVRAAEKCTNFWLGFKNKKTKLIPDYLSPKKAVYNIAKLDQSADLYSSFLRMHELTGKKKYLNEAKNGAKALNNFFNNHGWWHRIIDVKTGKPAKNNQVPKKDRPANINLTKYVGGALRLYLSLYEILDGKKISKGKVALLSRDR